MTQTSLFNQELAELRSQAYQVRIMSRKGRCNAPLRNSAERLAKTMEALLSGDAYEMSKMGISSDQASALSLRLAAVAIKLQKVGL